MPSSLVYLKYPTLPRGLAAGNRFGAGVGGGERQFFLLRVACPRLHARQPLDTPSGRGGLPVRVAVAHLSDSRVDQVRDR